MSLINHDGDSLNCVHYFSDIFDANTGIWWRCDDDNITKISDISKGVYIREIHQNILMSGSKDVLFIVYIKTSHLKNTALFFSRIGQHVQKQP